MLVQRCLRTGMHWSHRGNEMQKMTFMAWKLQKHFWRFYFTLSVKHGKLREMWFFFFGRGGAPISHSFDNNKSIIKALCIADDIWIQIDRIEPLQPVAQTCRQSHTGAPTAASQLLINDMHTWDLLFSFCLLCFSRCVSQIKGCSCADAKKYKPFISLFTTHSRDNVSV